MPFLGQCRSFRKKVHLKVVEMFDHILKPINNEYDDNDKTETTQRSKDIRNEKTSKKKDVINKKILSISKMLKMQRVLREERENIISIKNIDNKKLPQDLLLEGTDNINEFRRIKNLDIENEKRPE